MGRCHFPKYLTLKTLEKIQESAKTFFEADFLFERFKLVKRPIFRKIRTHLSKIVRYGQNAEIFRMAKNLAQNENYPT